MYTYITYQKGLGGQDTLVKAAATNTALNEQDSMAKTSQKKVYTHAQIRKWRLQQENKLQIDSSKYIAPRENMVLSTSKALEPSFVLPIREHREVNTDWFTALFFLGIILFATIRYAYSKYMEHLFLSLFNYATSVRLFQEKSYPLFHGAFRLEAIFYITFPIFIFQTLNLFKWESHGANPLNFLFVFGIVLLYFFVKKFLYRISGSMFQTQPETREYLFNIDNFNRSLGIILLPIVILISFAPVENPVFIVYVGILIVLIFNLLLLHRGILILLKKQFSIFYLFLYLCTLEFLPLLLIYKVVVE